MKKFSLFLIILMTSAVCNMLHAQGVKNALDAYNRYALLRDVGNVGEAYNVLYECCQKLEPLVKSTTKSSENYAELQDLVSNALPGIGEAYEHFAKTGVKNNAAIFAQFYLDFELSEAMEGVSVIHPELYPTMVYNTAATTFNHAEQTSNINEFKLVIRYFNLYLETNEQKHRADVAKYLNYASKKVEAYGGTANYASTSAASRTNAGGATAASGGAKGGSSTVNLNRMEPYSEFAKAYIEAEVNKWQAKGPYEKVEVYRKRVTEENRNAYVKELMSKSQQEYIRKYSEGIQLKKMLKLRPYDADNEVFLVESPLGELVVPVPLEKNQAPEFEKGWGSMMLSNVQYCISNDKLGIATVTFRTPSGRTYLYSNDKDLAYNDVKVDVQFDKLDTSLLATNTGTTSKKVNRTAKTVSVGQSDVDMNIPENKTRNENTFAVVICNENYSNVTAVPMALNDGNVFAQYCQKTLGLPKENVRLYKDASYGVMLRAMKDIKSIAQAVDDLKVIFYYAGHGIPNESTKDAFLLPVDADGTQTDGCYSLNKLYDELGGLGAQQVLVFLDACFSGAQRDGGMLASARGVALKAKKSDPRGNMVIFSAASDDETAMPYKDKNHGLFTYYLLKKMQETKGNVTLSDLGSYITQNVKRQATVVNKKPQTPTVSPSSSMADTWSKIVLVK